MKAIFVKNLPATNTKPFRFKAYDSAGNSLVLSKEALENQEDNSRFAPDFQQNFEAKIALLFCKKMRWDGTLIEGHFGDQSVFVFDTGKRFIAQKSLDLTLV